MPGGEGLEERLRAGARVSSSLGCTRTARGQVAKSEEPGVVVTPVLSSPGAASCWQGPNGAARQAEAVPVTRRPGGSRRPGPSAPTRPPRRAPGERGRQRRAPRGREAGAAPRAGGGG